MRDKRFSVLTLMLLLVALAALVLPPALLQGGVSSARWQANANSRRQLIRTGQPMPTPTPAAKRSAIVTGRPPAGANKTTTAPPPPPTTAQQKQGPGSVKKQGPDTMERKGNRILGSLPPGFPDLRDLNQKIDASELVPVDNRQPVTNSKPFTVDELKQKCGPGSTCAARLIQVEDKTNGTKETKVLSKGQRVPIADYVKQLNQFEAYLNKLGYSLRTGPPNLGKIVRLKPRKLNAPGLQPRRAKLEMFDPASRPPVDWKRDLRRNPALKLSPANVARLQAGENYLRGTFARPGSTVNFRLPGDSPLGEPRYIKYDLDCPCVQCAGPPKDLPPASGRNPICTDGKGNFIVCPTNPPSTPGVPDAPNKGYQSCSIAPKECRAGCLYDGRMADSWGGINQHYGANEGGWFGGDFDLFLGSSNCGMNGALNLVNGAKVTQNLYILGFQLPLIEANIATEWNGQWQKHADLKFFGVNYHPNVSFDKTIAGPRATIPIPPVPFPLVISSAFTLKLKSSPEHGQNPGLEPFNCDKSGTLSTGYGVSAYAGVELDAAIDAFVARAGLSTRLVLVDDYFGLGMSSKIMPAQNTIEVAPSLQYRMMHLKGSLFFFVEVDYLFDSKRWDVLLFDYADGIGTEGQTVNVPLGKPAQYHAAKEMP